MQPAREPDSEATIEHAIALVRGQRVLLDTDLASLYGVPTKALVQAVKRNLGRFPADFCFQLLAEDAAALRSRFVTSSGRGGRRYLPWAFTEQGVAMLASVLRSPRAVQVSIEVVRAFVRLRSLLSTHDELSRKLLALESRYDAQFKQVFDAIRELMMPRPPRSRPLGFRLEGAAPAPAAE